MIRTVLEQLQGCNDVDRLAPMSPPAGENGAVPAPTDQDPQPMLDCVVVGAGMSGLSVAGRLKALGLSYVVVDRNPQVGDNWLLRYDSVRLHTTREYSHLPFERTFTPEYNEYLTKYELARGFQAWVTKFGIVRKSLPASTFDWRLLCRWGGEGVGSLAMFLIKLEHYAFDHGEVGIVGRVPSSLDPSPAATKFESGSRIYHRMFPCCPGGWGNGPDSAHAALSKPGGVQGGGPAFC
jgi:hypothetical protein